MTPQLDYLRIALDRARGQVAYAKRELDRFERQADASDPRTERHLRTLERDVRQAEISAGWAEVALADATAPTEVPVG